MRASLVLLFSEKEEEGFAAGLSFFRSILFTTLCLSASPKNSVNRDISRLSLSLFLFAALRSFSLDYYDTHSSMRSRESAEIEPRSWS